jgi:predicted nucleic acid-binding protein
MTDARGSSALHSLFQRALLKSLTFSRKSHQSLPKTNVNCGSWGSAKTIISGDSHLLKLEQFKGIAIIKVADFLKKM